MKTFLQAQSTLQRLLDHSDVELLIGGSAVASMRVPWRIQGRKAENQLPIVFPPAVRAMAIEGVRISQDGEACYEIPFAAPLKVPAGVSVYFPPGTLEIKE